MWQVTWAHSLRNDTCKRTWSDLSSKSTPTSRHYAITVQLAALQTTHSVLTKNLFGNIFSWTASVRRRKKIQIKNAIWKFVFFTSRGRLLSICAHIQTGASWCLTLCAFSKTVFRRAKNVCSPYTWPSTYVKFEAPSGKCSALPTGIWALCYM